jgi:hypothetical protein
MDQPVIYSNNNPIQQKRRGISGSTLKLIAIITMLIDHIGAGILEQRPDFFQNHVLYDVDHVLRFIGRIAFPIFCFLLVEGFCHTRNIKKYAMRLLAFAIISEIPFDLAFSRKIFETSHQNVFFTLFLGLVTLAIMKQFEENKIVKILTIVAGIFAAEILSTDYAGFGVAFIILLYIFRDNMKFRNIFCSIAIMWEYTAPLAFIPISFYNGERGFNMKYFFYLFYPVHLLLLYAIAQFI